MILAGLKLMLMGMGIVFIFLAILVCTMKLTQRLLAKQTKKEFEEQRLASRGKLKKRREEMINSEDKILVAVISAAVAAHHASIKHQKAYKEGVVTS